MHKILILLALLVSISLSAQVYNHNFGTTTISTHPYTVNPGTFDSKLNTSIWANSTGVWTNLAGNVSQAISIAAISSGSITLKVNVNWGCTLLLNQFSFWSRRATTGPTDWALTIEGVSITSGTTGTTGADTGTTSFSDITVTDGTVNIVLTLTGGSGGSFRLDDFKLFGTSSTSTTQNRHNPLFF